MPPNGGNPTANRTLIRAAMKRVSQIRHVTVGLETYTGA